MPVVKAPVMTHPVALACQLALLLWWSNNLWAKDPATMYRMECQGCHLADGSGGLQNIPALKNHVAKFLDVSGGREYLVQVPGAAQSSLSNAELTDVLNWILQTFGPIESARRNAPYSVDEIAVLRKHPLTEVADKRANLVLLMGQKEQKPLPR